MLRVLEFIKRPFVGEQGTGRLAYQKSQGLTYASANGGAGIAALRTLRATNPASIVIGPSHRLNDPTVTGNTNTNIVLQPLINNDDMVLNAITNGVQL